MSEIKIGSKVKVHYIGKLNEGVEFENSYERETPLEFTIGDSKMLIDFENTIRTMKVGDKKSVDIKSERAYGKFKKEAEIKVSREEFPEDFRFIIDERIQGKTKNGQSTTATIREVRK